MNRQTIGLNNQYVVSLFQKLIPKTSVLALIIIIWAVGYLQREICEKTFLNRLLKDSNLIQVLQKNKESCDLKHFIGSSNPRQIYNSQSSFIFAYLGAVV